MPRYSMFPNLLDEVTKIQSAKFVEWGFFEPDKTLNSDLTWSRFGEVTLTTYNNSLMT